MCRTPPSNFVSIQGRKHATNNNVCLLLDLQFIFNTVPRPQLISKKVKSIFDKEQGSNLHIFKKCTQFQINDAEKLANLNNLSKKVNLLKARSKIAYKLVKHFYILNDRRKNRDQYAYCTIRYDLYGK